MLLKTALHDEFGQDKQQRGRSQRLPDHFKGKTKSNGSIPIIPGHLLDLIRKVNISQAAGLILKWKNIWNVEKRHIRSDELRLNDNIDSNHRNNKQGYSKDGKRKGGNHKNDNKGNKNPIKRRLSIIAKEPARATTRRTVKTQNTTAGVTRTTVVVSIKDPGEMKDTMFTDLSSGDNTETEEAVGNKDNKQSKTSKSKSTACKQWRTRKWRFKLRRKTLLSVKAYRQEIERLQLVYSTGTDIEVVGRGWHIVHKWPVKSITLDGALTGMESTKNLPMVAAVTAIDPPTGTNLLGLVVSVYNNIL